jgi:large subunit ribosomal protein L3
MGVDQVTVRNLKVVRVMAEDHTLIVEGAVPGPTGAYVVVRRAKAPHVKAAVVKPEAENKKK